MALKKKRLGRGLGSLIGNVGRVVDVSPEEAKNLLQEVDIERIQRGEYQPRKNFDEAALRELADSIRAQGVIQPVVVRANGDGYELIAGERRWRAAQLAGLQKIPVVVRDIDSKSAAAIALIENIQREDLNPLEESAALERLIKEFDLTHQQVADSVGRSRTAVTNLLRLLDLRPEVKAWVNQGALGMGHARALLMLDADDQVEAARIVVNRGLSVRETEALVKQYQQPVLVSAIKEVDPDVKRLEESLSEKLCAKIAIQQGKGGSGKLVIHYHNSDELEGILGHIS
ncbi:MAG: ParB/RepB/Spo0J family partition protein [Gammaproteobacteria bacterium]|nr:ParB/RepB/Spo0J family partition protein [Gammaproteobacteria bacterium]